jgi:hypothetical protein
LIDTLLERPWPSVNTGIFGAKPDSPVLPLWHQWTLAAKDTFIPDEIVMHLMVAKFGPTNEISVAGGGKWNCSPKLQPVGLADSDVKIWHFHGDSGWRIEKSRKGVQLWYPVFCECLDKNIGGIEDWYKDIPSKWFQTLIREIKTWDLSI